MYSPIRRNTRKQGNTSAFDGKILRQVQENRQIIIKEEGNKEEDRQEESDLKKKKIVKNVYTDLKRRHQNDQN